MLRLRQVNTNFDAKIKPTSLNEITIAIKQTLRHRLISLKIMLK